MDALLKRFSEQAPVAVMARLGLRRAIGAEWVNQVFEEHSETQYTRELLFSKVVELMSLVALGMRPSLHAAAQKMKEHLPVSMTALYDKVNRVEPAVVRALVSGSAVRLGPVMAPLRPHEGGELKGLGVTPGTALADELRLVQADDRLGERVVVRVADGADRALDASLGFTSPGFAWRTEGLTLLDRGAS